MTASKPLHRFDSGFIPTADRAHDSITVTRNSQLIWRKREAAGRLHRR